MVFHVLMFSYAFHESRSGKSFGPIRQDCCSFYSVMFVFFNIVDRILSLALIFGSFVQILVEEK